MLEKKLGPEFHFQSTKEGWCGAWLSEFTGHWMSAGQRVTSHSIFQGASGEFESEVNNFQDF